MNRETSRLLEQLRVGLESGDLDEGLGQKIRAGWKMVFGKLRKTKAGKPTAAPQSRPPSPMKREIQALRQQHQARRDYWDAHPDEARSRR